MADYATVAQVANALETLALVAVGVYAARAAWSAADANRESAKEARALNASVQQAAKPHLEFWDRIDELKRGDVTAIPDAPAIVLLRNYGGRPARIEKAEFQIDEIVQGAELLTNSVVMPGDLVQFRLDWSISNELKDARWGHNLAEGDGEGRLRLRFSYTEVDGTGRVVDEVRTSAVAIRPPKSSGATIKVLGSAPPAEPA